MFLLILFLIVLSIVWWSIKNGISPMPTSPRVKAALFASLPTVEGTIADLGSGWGTLVFPLADRYPKCQVIGYETSPIPYTLSLLRQTVQRRANLSLIRRDFFEASLENAALVLCYLYPKAMTRLQDKFDRELKNGAFVISHTFALPEWQPLKVVEVNDLYRTKIYIYKKGSWSKSSIS
jgi:hypothetical protein